MFPLNVAAAAAGVPSGPRVQLLSVGVLSDFQNSGNSGVTTRVAWQLTLAGGNFQTQQGNSAGLITRFPWLLKGNAADYDVFFQDDGFTGTGTPDWVTGPMDTWLNLGGSRNVAMSEFTLKFGFNFITGKTTIIIRDASTLDVLASRQYTGQMDVES